MSNIFNTAVAAIASPIIGLFRRKVETKLVTIPQADNDNGLKARLRGSTAGIYRVGNAGKRSLAIHVCPVEAARVGLNVGDRVAVEMRGEDFIIRPATKRGATIKADKNSLVIRAAMCDAPLTGAFRVTLSRMDEGAVLVRRHDGGDGGGEPVPSAEGASEKFPMTFLDDFKSLKGFAGKMRRAFLIANDNEQKATTSAGDQCYTPIFFIMAILRAAMKEMFDIDCCSMQPDGRYDRGLTRAAVKAGTWPSPVDPKQQLQVIGSVPAKRHMTKADTDMGSLLLAWLGEFIWLNPPYSRRAWAVFLEKAAREVAANRAEIVVALVPMDTYGSHIRHMFDENAYRIELSERLPFFMKRKVRPNGTVDENVIETIKGNSLVVFGKGTKTRDFLIRLVGELLAIGFITEEQARHYRQVYAVWPNLQMAA